ncbi:branched-chain amino acid ABC transporter permease [Actinotalea sp. M2MS4P-6]|uniref:branched-chain amino acid ABC transporter permease n=1 Tax=Actinotalea sp. M2MS4P-6 TaxID=2983762 RepID=UPI00296253E9|nr:branched-chain amino acid ABC transporter permease [Actinotalea sp. M2MS4P-6]
MITAFAALLVTALPASAAAEPACSPDPETACLIGTMRTAAGDPAVGVQLEVVGPDGSETVTTGDDGRWVLAVHTAGEYTVNLDVETLPAGETLRDPTVTSRTLTIELNSQAGALFALGEPTSSGDATAEPSSASPSDTSTDSDPTTETPSTSPGTNRVAQQFANGLVFGLLLALASVGLSLVYGTTGLSSFSHGEQVTLGAILAYVGVQLVGLPLWAAALAAIAIGGATGWLQNLGIWAPLRRRRVGLTQQMIVTIGLSMALQYLFQFFFGGGRLRIVTTSSSPVRIGPVVMSVQTLISAGIAIVVLAGVAMFLMYTRTGRATRAVSDNPALAAASGIGVESVIRTVWVGATALAALGGVLTGLYFQATTWNMGGTILLLMFAAVTLGGLGTAFGALAGSMVIGIVSEMASLVMPSDMRFAGALLILILVLLIRPQGILGRRDRIG